MRAPATILPSGRNSFVLSVPPASDGDGDSEWRMTSNEGVVHPAFDPNPDASSPTIASDLSAMVAAGPSELLAALQRRAADLAGGGGKAPNPKPNAEDGSAAASAPPASAEADAEAGAEAGEGEAADAAPEGKPSAWVQVASEVRPAASPSANAAGSLDWCSAVDRALRVVAGSLHIA